MAPRPLDESPLQVVLLPELQSSLADVLWYIGLELEVDGLNMKKQYTALDQALLKKALTGELLLLSRLETDVLQVIFWYMRGGFPPMCCHAADECIPHGVVIIKHWRLPCRTLGLSRKRVISIRSRSK